MTFLKNLIEQLRSTWRQAGAAGRVGFVAAAALCVAAVIGVGIWSSRPDYVALASGLNPGQTSAIVAKLESQGIDYKLDFAGASVLVASDQLGKARLAAGELVTPDLATDPDLETSFLEDLSLTDYKLLRRQEAALARTIMKIQGVASATVHLAQPENTPFIRDQTPATASVVLELRPGAAFGTQQASSVQQLVAGAVAGLTPSQVVVSDNRGRVLSIDASAVGSDIAGQFELRRSLEAELGAKAEVMLAQMLGPGKALVRVTAELDFTRTKRSETIYDPDGQVKRSEFVRSSNRKESPPTAGGAGGAPGAQRSPASTSEEESTSEYETAKTESETDQAGGKIVRLTIAATVDIGETKGPDGKPIAKEEIEALIKHAVGFDDQERSDKITVVTTTLPGLVVEEEPGLAETQEWARYNQIIRSASLGVAGVVALLLGWLTLRRLKPGPPQDEIIAQATHRAGQLKDLSDRAKQRPDAVADVIAAWLDETDEKTPVPLPQPRAA